MTTLTVTAKGQVTFRQELLRYLGVQPGQQIEVSTLPGGSIEVRAAQPLGSIEAFISRLGWRSALLMISGIYTCRWIRTS
jgi:bifunctional DNA-binding transcriptional regulator/antitoxin component of YhaV-PrlF toxin-antitoxin module